MKFILIALLTLPSNFAFGQFAIIDDKDGFCNVRSHEIGNHIIDKLENGHLVYCLALSDTKGNWIDIDYNKGSREFNGDIYHDRLKLISVFEKIPAQTIQPNIATFSKDSIKVIVSQQHFDKRNYRFSYQKDAKDQILLINNKHFWGTDSGQPKNQYKSILIFLGSRKISLPIKAHELLFEPNLSNTQVNYDKANDILYIQSMNGDGAGGYVVIWKIQKGFYKTKYVTHAF